MKVNSLLSVTFLSLSIFFFGCQQTNSPETVLSGKVTGIEVDSLKLTYIKNDYLEGPETIWVQLDSSARFTASLPVSTLKEFNLVLDEQQEVPVYMKTGWSTHVNVYLNEEGKLDSVTFTGDGSAENKSNYNIEKILYEAYNHMQKDPAQYIVALDSIDQVMQAEVTALEGADPEIVEMLQNNVNYHKMGRWESYAKRKFDYSGKERPDSLKEYESQFKSLVVFDNPELLKSNFYKAMMEDYFNGLVRDSLDFEVLLEANDGDEEKAIGQYYSLSLNMMLDFGDSIITDPEIKSYYYYHTFLRNMGLPSIDPLKQNFADRFQQVVSDTAKTNYIKDQIAQVEMLLPGKPAPTFTFPDTTGNMVSLVDLQGKYVYIDVWATWCGPCIREIPKLKELEEEFGEEIIFMSVSIDPEKDTWHKYVREKELTGIQLYSEGSWQSEINELYLIQGIPRFIMIDPEGNIVDADASRPSHEKTRKLFEEWTGRNQIAKIDDAI